MVKFSNQAGVSQSNHFKLTGTPARLLQGDDYLTYIGLAGNESGFCHLPLLTSQLGLLLAEWQRFIQCEKLVGNLMKLQV